MQNTILGRKLAMLLFVLAMSSGALQAQTQEPKSMTPEEREALRQRLDVLRDSLQQLFKEYNNLWNQQMEEYRDQWQDAMKDYQGKIEDEMKEWQDRREDSTYNYYYHFNMPQLPEVPPIPEPPAIPDFRIEQLPTDTTVLNLGNWKMIISGADKDDHSGVQILKHDDDDMDHDGDQSCSSSCSNKNLQTRFLSLDVGFNTYFSPGLSSTLPSGYDPLELITGKSVVVNIHAFDQQLNLVKHIMYLTYGIYFELNTYRFRSNDVIIPRIDSVAFTSSDVTYEKNKLSNEYIGIPLMLRFETNPNNQQRSFHFSAGGFAEYFLGAHTKQKSVENGKQKTHDDFNMNPWRYGASVRIGYSFCSLFANYSFSKFFRDDLTPTLYPASFGLAFEF